MATFDSNATLIHGSAETVFDTLSNPENLKHLLDAVPLDQVPEDKREMLDGIEVTSDTISFPAGPVGKLTLRVSHLERPRLITLEGEGAPVQLDLSLKLTPVSDSTCEGIVSVDINIPMMLRPMISGPLQQLVDEFAAVLGNIPFSAN